MIGGRTRPRRFGPVYGAPSRRIRPIVATRGFTPAERILRSASFYMDARDLTSTTQQTLPNRADSGATVATMGSTTGSETSDPTRLPYSGTPHVYLPGSSGNYLSVPDSNDLDITGDLEIVVRVSPQDWTPSANTSLVNKATPAYALFLVPGGLLRLYLASTNSASTAAVPFTDGSTGWVKVTRRQSDGRIQFFTAADSPTEPSSWTQLGADVSGTTASMTVNALKVAVGADTAGTAAMAGGVYRAIVRNGIGGTTVLDINTAVDTLGQSSFICTTGQTVTVNRSTSGLKTEVVTSGALALDGSDDRLLLPASAAPTFTATAGEDTVLVMFRRHQATASGFLRLYSSESATNNGLLIETYTTSPYMRCVVGGPVSVNAAAPPRTYVAGDLEVIAAKVSNGLLTSYIHGSGSGSALNFSAFGTITHNPVPTIGLSAALHSPIDASVMAFARFGKLLSDAELDAVSAYLKRGR